MRIPPRIKTTLVFTGLATVGMMAISSHTLQSAQPSKDRSLIKLGDCRLEYMEHVVLAAGRAGIVAFVNPEEGDRVEEGTRIAGLRNEAAQAAYDIAKQQAENDINIRFAKKSADVAKIEHERALITNRKRPNAVPEVEVMHLKLAAENQCYKLNKLSMSKKPINSAANRRLRN